MRMTAGVWITNREDGDGGHWLSDGDRDYRGEVMEAAMLADERNAFYPHLLYEVKEYNEMLPTAPRLRPSHVAYKPEFITFTGADDRTDIGAMEALAVRYPAVEFGILLSERRMGSSRYPTWEWLAKASVANFRKSAHVCGGWATLIMAGREPPIREALTFYRRVQVNARVYGHDAIDNVSKWAFDVGLDAVMQCRQFIPSDDRVSWLFDESGGAGKEPDHWPAYFGARMVGFAGGIGPLNVMSVCGTVGSRTRRYWIDMETRVRNDRDELDLGMCEAVCRAVYG